MSVVAGSVADLASVLAKHRADELPGLSYGCEKVQKVTLTKVVIIGGTA